MNGTMMQYFESGISHSERLWRKVSYEAGHLADLGITALWLPPAYKGAHGKNDVGYGVYDLYDLGEFDQKGTIQTKYGTKEDYLWAIQDCHRYGLQVYADMVFDHKMGADEFEVVEARSVAGNNRLHTTSKKHWIKAPTMFYFNGRYKYSPFIWTKDHFKGVDFDLLTYKKGIYLFEGKQWSDKVDKENGNYDYLMGADVDVNYPDVRDELVRFGHWYTELTQVDGFRLDAIKHIDYEFYRDWLKEMRTKRDFFCVGEYWSGITDVLCEYLYHVDYSMSLFDVPLHYRFYECSNNKDYDLRNLYRDTLVSRDPMHAVTFVDNHDTAPRQGLSTYVKKWFKPMAYACILLRQEGYPCVFYGDYYGLKTNKGIQKELDILLKCRKLLAYGYQRDYIDNDYFGFTRDAGVGVLFSLRHDQELWMEIGHANEVFVDVFHPSRKVYINQDGWGCFFCEKEKLSVFIPEYRYGEIKRG
ncbi:MAG: alpha-amylase [Erysipelotrichaceae bacterium]|nr:alpha-amylase [Erysipelotrichaceae bacterium]